MRAPVLLFGGIWDTESKLEPIARALRESGRDSRVKELSPNDGSRSIPELADQVKRSVDALGDHTQVDLVGFSMGALVVRYYIQRLGGRDRVRRFISLAGPHEGTLTAHALSLPGVRDMRPGSALLKELASDRDPWGKVEVHTIYTPFDLMIMPPRSSRLLNTKSHTRVPTLMHRWLVKDPRVIRRVVELLSETAST